MIELKHEYENCMSCNYNNGLYYTEKTVMRSGKMYLASFPGPFEISEPGNEAKMYI